MRDTTAAATIESMNTPQIRMMNGTSGIPNFNMMLTANEPSNAVNAPAAFIFLSKKPSKKTTTMPGAMKPVYSCLIGMELGFHRVVDWFYPKDKADLADLTVVIKTFERPYAVRRLVASIQRRYPRISIMVVGQEPGGTYW